ncbi:hypothetical protein P167DRAFT_580782, partial [Morchella conica CCBAS932]
MDVDREARFWGITADAAPDSVSAWPSFHRGGNTRKARKTAGAQKAREEQQVNGGVVKVEWRCNVCKEPLMGGEVASHRAGQCKGSGDGGAAEKKEEEEQVDDAARVAALVRWLGGLGVKKGDIEAGAPRPLENLRGGTRKERKMARDLAEAQKRREERDADGGGVKCEWKCDVCEEPLLGEELVSHKAWHCRGGPGGGSKVEKGGEAGQQPPPWKARWRKEKEKEREEEEDVVVPTPPPLPRWSPSSSTTMPAREPQSQQQPKRPQAPSPPATATPALQPEVAPPPRTAPPPPQPQPPTYSTAITTATAPTALPTTFFCAPCNKTLPPANRTTHLASRKHLQNTQSTPQFFTPPTPQLFTPHLPAPTFIPPPPAPPPPPDLPYETYLCEQCNKWFGVSGRSGHEAAEKHKKRAAAWAARMREVHGPGWEPPTPPTPPAAEVPCAVPSAAQSAAPSAVPSAAPSAVETFFCTPCNKSFALLGRAGHLNGQKHTKKAAAIAGEAEKKEATTTAAASHPTGAAPTLPLKTYCAVCDATYFTLDMPTHRAGRKHLQKAAAAAGTRVEPPVSVRPEEKVVAWVYSVHNVEEEEEEEEEVTRVGEWVTVMGGVFRCEACGRERSLQGLEAHVGSELHRRNVRVAEEER